MTQKIHRILFVDDDPYILKGIKRSVDQYSDVWEVDFASSGYEAAENIMSQVYDAIVTDMLMPGMDGVGLLEIVNSNSPETLRFILSGNTNDSQAYRSVLLVHQVFPKPCEIGRIYRIVESCCVMKDRISESALMRKITGLNSLPSHPVLCQDLLRELELEEPNQQIIGKIISHDIGASAKMLQVVNSAFWGTSTSISNPQKAVNYLGLNTTKHLLSGGFALSRMQADPASIELIEDLIHHSLLVSRVARMIANDLVYSSQDKEDAYIAGFLHDIWRLIEYSTGNFYNLVDTLSPSDSTASNQFQPDKLHTLIPAYLLKIWGLPLNIVDAIEHYRAPSKKPIEKADVTLALHIADGLVNKSTVLSGMNFDELFDMDAIIKMSVIDQLDNWFDRTKALINDTRDDPLFRKLEKY